MELIIDSRENKLLSFLTESTYKKEYLPIGDVLFGFEQTKILVERKTWCDLWSSIRDGRYREQRSRLLEWKDSNSNLHSILYLIEGNEQELENEDAQETCKRTLYRLMLAYQIPIIFTKNPQETVDWIVWFYHKKDIHIFLRKMDTQQERIENIQQRFDKKTIQNPKTMLITFLRSISGVSYNMAQLIANKYSCLSDFIQHKQDLEATIATMEYETSTKKSRKIGTKMAKKIVEMLG